ncbi:aminotransferase [Luteitalea sp. TBR-22]|uniref:pyridoxal phosphate-dependent aminotransferase n=1 Tax=Luteitalea sp. TBR-22 TaxID=2802971 RepID=UPI001AFC4F2B|nr:pyridoxal phosphate-dependent aminotransferase [Luteitalea sp. TBR-22]BCS31251.1 aminotransferase [Luteitalea sp. TBR-22]
MFSTRLPSSLVPSPLAAAVAARRARPGRLIDLTQSNPTTAGVAYPETLAAAWSNVAALRYAPDPRGLATARAAVADWHASVGDVIDADRLILTASTSEAYSHLFKLLCNPGDRVLVPCPSYPLFEHLAQLDAVAVDRYTFRDAGRWELDQADLRDRITPRTRALVVVSPNNPTGSVPSPAEWAALADACRAHRLALIVDEVFAAYPLAPGVDYVRTPRLDDVLTFRLNGLSKLVGLPQAKLGWIVVEGPDGLARQALEALELIADTYLSVSTPVQLAAPTLIADGAVVRTAIAARLRANLAHLMTRVAGTAVDVRMPEGGWSVVLRVPCVGEPDDLALALLARDVVVHPGYFYDLPHDGYLVLSLLAPEADMRAGLDVLCGLPLLQPA